MAQRLQPDLRDERIEQGLRAQLELLDRRIAEGERPAGWKIALNSPGVQRQLKLEGPLIGFLTSSSEHPPGSPVELVGTDAPHLLEVEIALSVANDLPAHPSQDECESAIGALAPAFEILRFDGRSNDLAAILGANVYHERAIFGPADAAAKRLRTSELSLQLRVNGGVPVGLDEDLVIGEPGEIVEFVARLLARYGRTLRAGDRILCGSLNPPVVIRPGDRLEADLRPLGRLSLDVLG